jgi:hypothetical protein
MVKVKALQNFSYFNYNGYFEVQQDEVFEVDEKTYKDLLAQGLVEIFTNETTTLDEEV